ncbi:MAG: hypothetical protein AABY22_04870 [Nanoarchaeota archaeon]
MEKELKTIKDILDVVNSDNFENFLIDFRAWLKLHIEIKKLNNPDMIIRPNKESFKWIDDGKNNMILRFEIKNE